MGIVAQLLLGMQFLQLDETYILWMLFDVLFLDLTPACIPAATVHGSALLI